MSLWNPVCFVLLCKSVRKNTPRHSYKTSNKGQCEAYIHSIGVSRWSLPFPSGEGPGEGPLSSMSPVCSVLLCSLWETEKSSVRNWNILCEGRNAKQSNRECQKISTATSLSFRGHAPHAWRRCLSAIEKRPFKGQEHALLEARKACPQTLLVNFWFLVGYKQKQRGGYSSIS